MGDAFQTIVNINLIGTFLTGSRCASQMAKQEPNADGERGCIVNISSVAAMDGQNGQIGYSASKAGVVGMTLPMARDLGRFGIRVNTICPGLVDTQRGGAAARPEVAPAGAVFPAAPLRAPLGDG